MLFTARCVALFQSENDILCYFAEDQKERDRLVAIWRSEGFILGPRIRLYWLFFPRGGKLEILEHSISETGYLVDNFERQNKIGHDDERMEYFHSDELHSRSPLNLPVCHEPTSTHLLLLLRQP
ncbi:hypothetical protein TNIN_93551 [Trichonephila inaurata madagascariensis]|uniref:Uncharacterized protein n=1 Tax=Trichonephila inaurata madagascariensis TaxID=2747483 RepID=A0A8X6WXQ4_9ARAC|nr:hypothetical protein TNIN_93551 [Trichonephila inaurata madagascariensis]